MKKKILVVGGAGYIGSHMVLALQDEGHEVVVFDNLSRGHADAVNGARLVVGDLRAPQELAHCFAGQSFDLVMHFAALAYVGESVVQPDLYYQNNVLGTLNLLAAMRQHGVGKFVFSSTCATYGEPESVPIAEDHSQNPINPYGRSKLMVEQVLRDFGEAYGLQSVGLRYFNAAGCDREGRAGERHEPETHLIPLVLAEALRVKTGGNPAATMLEVYGTDFDTPDGSCVRDYIHVSDLCRAHLLAAERLLSGAVKHDRPAEFYNLANGNGFSVLDVIRTCEAVTGVPIRYRSARRRVGDPAVLVGDASLAGKILGWNAQYGDLSSIVQTAWDWMSRVPVGQTNEGQAHEVEP
ncbi:UDP-glucose 4-epimerase GalE [Parvibaculum sedimenti]|uniref:UDP-glucose 4-epimerase n=1 Tax=Parvibaculum sedimenti TaxID=2608632 RepID=A0A6N6VRP9_9HYPH|nr:UDP-glucose 4-epimerase GalE [Parvibaculum sedimenti]KAB7742153.1 UDP-glucose 4-epimerase GalE [Parvibaculum sedimenti]